MPGGALATGELPVGLPHPTLPGAEQHRAARRRTGRSEVTHSRPTASERQGQNLGAISLPEVYAPAGGPVSFGSSRIVLGRVRSRRVGSSQVQLGSP